jgi:endogenous inhibitor of DNA gyrase (YacG/DUF329 family)
MDAAQRAKVYPFCSERCKVIDLGRWLDERYQIPVEPAETDDGPGKSQSNQSRDDADDM